MDSSLPVRWLGCDCGERDHALALLSAAGRQDRRWGPVRNHPQVLEELLGKIAREVGPARLRVVVEMRGGCGRTLCRAAVALGLEVWVVPPQALQSFRQSEGQPRKDDPLDAFLLARMGFVGSGRCRPLADPGPQEQRLCRVTRLCRRVVERHTRAMNRLRSRLLELHPALVNPESGTPAWRSRRLLDVLSVHPTLGELAELAPVEIASWLRTVALAQRNREAQALQRIASEIDLSPEEREVLELEIRILVEEIDSLRRTCTELRRRIRQYVEEHPLGPKLLEMPGVGPTTAGVLIGEILPLARHVSEAAVATYAGVTPLSRRSGQSPGRDRIVRGANKHVLRVLYQSSMSATRCGPLDQAYYAKKKAGYNGHPSPHTAAILALTRQRLKLMYKLLTTDERYDPQVLIRSHLERRDRIAA